MRIVINKIYRLIRILGVIGTVEHGDSNSDALICFDTRSKS